MARFRLAAVAGIPTGSISLAGLVAMRRGTENLEEALEFAKRIAYDAAWPILIHDAMKNGLATHRVSVLGIVMRLAVPTEMADEQATFMPAK